MLRKRLTLPSNKKIYRLITYDKVQVFSYSLVVIRLELNILVFVLYSLTKTVSYYQRREVWYEFCTRILSCEDENLLNRKTLFLFRIFIMHLCISYYNT